MSGYLQCLPIVCFVALTGCSDPRSPAEQRQESCKALIDRYQPSLERMYEIEMHAYRSSMPDIDGDWYKAAIKLGVELFDSLGHARDLSAIVNDALSRVAKVPDSDERRQMEYTLLGLAMPLEARKAFEEDCVGSNNGLAPR
jgi:hypothetical protein